MGAVESVPETSIHEFTVKVRRSPLPKSSSSFGDPVCVLKFYVAGSGRTKKIGDFFFVGAGLQRQGSEPGDLQGEGPPRCQRRLQMVSSLPPGS